MEIILMENNRIKSTFLRARNWIISILGINTNEANVVLSALISIVILIINFGFLFYYSSYGEIIKQGGFWTLLTLIVSSPVAFMIWSFRDRNATDQINNSRKDTNLKEYHKIVEWITNKDSSDELKISAIYYLRRFYEDKSLGFQQAALHLLLSTWESMQKNELERLKKVNDSVEADSIINSLRENGNSPLGVAITNVLLSNDGECILAYPKVFSSICLAGMNFYLPGLSDNTVNNLFNNKSIKYSGIQLQGCVFKKLNLNNVDFSNSNLLGTKWAVDEFQDEIFWNDVNFSECEFKYSIFDNVLIENCNFSKSNFMNATFIQMSIDELTDFSGVNLIRSSSYYGDISRNGEFLGSIILESDFSNWVYECKDNYEHYDKSYKSEDFKNLGMFILYQGDDKYKSCELEIRHKTYLGARFFYLLDNISISNLQTNLYNGMWNIQIEKL